MALPACSIGSGQVTSSAKETQSAGRQAHPPRLSRAHRAFNWHAASGNAEQLEGMHIARWLGGVSVSLHSRTRCALRKVKFRQRVLCRDSAQEALFFRCALRPCSKLFSCSLHTGL